MFADFLPCFWAHSLHTCWHSVRPAPPASGECGQNDHRCCWSAPTISTSSFNHPTPSDIAYTYLHNSPYRLIASARFRHNMCSLNPATLRLRSLHGMARPPSNFTCSRRSEINTCSNVQNALCEISGLSSWEIKRILPTEPKTIRRWVVTCWHTNMQATNTCHRWRPNF